MDELYTPIKTKRISEEIVEQIKALIFKGNLKPGEALPPERALANLCASGITAAAAWF